MTSNCVICNTTYVTGSGFSANRITSIDSSPTDLNGFHNSQTYTYTIFSNTLCSYCPINIASRNQQLIISDLETNQWVN